MGAPSFGRRRKKNSVARIADRCVLPATLPACQAAAITSWRTIERADSSSGSSDTPRLAERLSHRARAIAPSTLQCTSPVVREHAAAAVWISCCEALLRLSSIVQAEGTPALLAAVRPVARAFGRASFCRSSGRHTAKQQQQQRIQINLFASRALGEERGPSMHS